MDTAEIPAIRPQRRRWLRYSLRTLLVLLTVLCIWLGVTVDRAQRQRRAVAAIQAVEGLVAYENEPEPDRSFYLDRFNQTNPNQMRVGVGKGRIILPLTLKQQLQNWLGIDYFISVTAVSVDGRRVDDELVVHLRDLPKLKKLFIHHAKEGDPILDQLRSALPQVELIY